MITHTLYGAQPPGRADGTAWDRVRVEESATKDGAYTAVVTQAIAIDATPETPDPINITFQSALSTGWFRLVFLDPSNNESPPTEPVLDDGSDTPTSVSRPNTQAVANLLTTRTRTVGGEVIGDFSAATTPTKAQVESRIAEAYNFVIGRFGDIDDPFLSAKATHLIAIYSAMMVELSYYPEQINNDRSPYRELKKLFDDGMDELYETLFPEADDGGPTGPGFAMTPDYGFPATSIGDGIMP